jgi:hypothetical protein
MFGERIKVSQLIEWIGKGILLAIVNKTRCYKCLSKMSDKECKKCNQKRHEELQELYKKQRR